MHKCILCGKTSKSPPHLNFHLFPKDEDRKNEWLKNINYDYPINNWHRICSDHFVDGDYRPGSGNKKILWSEAVPKHNVNNLLEIESNTGMTQRMGDTSSKRKSCFSNDEQVENKNKRFGDLTVDDFSSPRKALKNFNLIQSTIEDLRYKNKLLRQKK